MSVSTIDPDQEWTVTKNPEYSNIAWYSSPDGSFEAKVAKESPLDKWTGLNYNKIPNGPNEYYGYNQAPLYQYEWDEDEYYRNWVPSKTDEQLEEELNEPVKKMEEKLEKSLEQGKPIVWTPTLEAMSNNCYVPPARKIEYDISPYIQLNEKGYRKNWANGRLSEFRPILRIQQNIMNNTTDYFFRYQMMRWHLSSKMRMRYWKMAMACAFTSICVDSAYSRQYKRKLKWH